MGGYPKRRLCKTSHPRRRFQADSSLAVQRSGAARIHGGAHHTWRPNILDTGMGAGKAVMLRSTSFSTPRVSRHSCVDVTSQRHSLTGYDIVLRGGCMSPPWIWRRSLVFICVWDKLNQAGTSFFWSGQRSRNTPTHKERCWYLEWPA